MYYEADIEEGNVWKTENYFFSSISVVIVIVAVLLYFFVLKPNYETVLSCYSDTIKDYNEIVSEYNDKKAQMEYILRHVITVVKVLTL